MLIFSDVYTNLSLTNFLTVLHIDIKVKTIKSKNKATKSITFNKLKQNKNNILGVGKSIHKMKISFQLVIKKEGCELLHKHKEEKPKLW